MPHRYSVERASRNLKDRVPEKPNPKIAMNKSNSRPVSKTIVGVILSNGVDYKSDA